MKGAIYNGTKNLVVAEIPPVDLGPDDVRIRVDSATICGTDIHILNGHFEIEPPVVLGHEFAGYVVEMGSNVSGLSIGELVSVEPHVYCGVCKPCRTGRPNLCKHRKAWGIHLDGGFAEYVVCRKDTVYKVPPKVSAELAAMAEMVGCCLNGVMRGQIGIGDTVVVSGGGAAGAVIAALASKRGATRVVISEPSAEKRSILDANGSAIVVDPESEDLVGYVEELTGGEGADVVVEASGNVKAGQLATGLVGHGGSVVFFGVVPPGRMIEIEPNEVYRKELNLVGAVRNPFTHHRVMETFRDLDLGWIVTHRFPLGDINEALGVAASGKALKVCVKPNG